MPSIDLPMKRNTSIDIARGIAIVAVVIGHLWCWHSEYVSIKKYVYCFHMPLFFMIAGMCLKLDVSVRSFVLRKCKRLIVPYLVFGLVALLSLTTIVGVLDNFSYNRVISFVAKRFWGFLYGTTSSVKLSDSVTVCEAGMIWFLLALFISFVLVAVFGKSTRGWGVLVGLSALAVGVKWLGCPLLPFSLQAACIGVLFVGAGMLLDKLLNKINDRLIWKVLLAAVGCCAYILVVSSGLSLNIAKIEFDHALIPVCSLLIGAGIIVGAGFLSNIPGFRQAASFIGRHTMIIYGMHHIYISGGLAVIASRHIKAHPEMRAVLLVTEVLFPFVAGALLLLVVSKVKALKRIEKCIG